MATMRRYCRICGDLAGMTRDVCSGCRAGEMAEHDAKQQLARHHKGQPLQDLYSKSLKTLPDAPRKEGKGI